MPAVQLIKDDEQFKITVNGGLDAKGKRSVLDGPPTFTSGDAALATAGPDPGGDPNSCLVKAVDLTPDGAPVRITVSADARIGDEVNTIEDFVDVTVVAGEAVTLGMVVGTVEKQPA